MRLPKFLAYVARIPQQAHETPLLLLAHGFVGDAHHLPNSLSAFLSRPLSSLPPAHTIECHRGRGQHLLKNPRIVEAIVEKSLLRKSDTVLEIGPGTGNLTLRLLEKVRKVIAVEVDPRMVEELERRVQQMDHASKLEVIRGDIMRMDLPDFDICVANIPYQISSPLIFKLLNHASKFRAAVLMLQKEFARRLSANSGDPLFCRLSVNTQLLASVDLLMEVSKENFSPPPKVDSSVIRINPNPRPLPVNLREWDGLIRLCFNRKNKTLGAIFRQKHALSMLYHSSFGSGQDTSDKLGSRYQFEDHDSLGLKCENEMETCSRQELFSFKEKVIDVLREGGFEQKRSVKLKQEDFLNLLSSLNEAGIHFCFGNFDDVNSSPL